MKAFIFDPLWEELVTDELLTNLKDSGIEIVVKTEIAPLSECKELFEGDEERLLCLNPDYVSWKLPSSDYKVIPNLKAILIASTGFEWVELDVANERNIPVCQIVNFSTQAVAEWAVMMMFNLARQTPRLIKDNYPLDFAKGLAQEAGEVMLQHFQVGVLSETKAHEGDTPVTIADTAINTMVIEAIRKQYPTHAVIGEEESYGQENADYTWVCDPIDGTIPYVMGVPTNVFSLALVNKEGQPVVAVVYDPYMKRKYWATKDGGAFMNDLPISVNKVGEMKDAYIGGSGGRSSVLKAAEFKGAVIAACYRPVILSCVMYEAMLVASGQMAATVFPGAGCHDAVSAKLIVEEAGGKVTDVFGNEQRYDEPIKGAIISNGLVHGELVRLANNYKKEQE